MQEVNANHSAEIASLGDAVLDEDILFVRFTKKHVSDAVSKIQNRVADFRKVEGRADGVSYDNFVKDQIERIFSNLESLKPEVVDAIEMLYSGAEREPEKFDQRWPFRWRPPGPSGPRGGRRSPARPECRS